MVLDLETKRLRFHAKLCEILGSSNCYFQPTENIRMKYPCIVYSREDGDMLHANDDKYRYIPEYTTTVIDRDPTSDIPEHLLESFRMSRLDRSYISDGLNHTVLTIFY